MSTEHTHHHHHKKKDGASAFKYKSLAAIERRKTFTKIFKIILIAVAILMAIAVCVAYTVG